MAYKLRSNLPPFPSHGTGLNLHVCQDQTENSVARMFGIKKTPVQSIRAVLPEYRFCLPHRQRTGTASEMAKWRISQRQFIPFEPSRIRSTMKREFSTVVQTGKKSENRGMLASSLWQDLTDVHLPATPPPLLLSTLLKKVTTRKREHTKKRSSNAVLDRHGHRSTKAKSCYEYLIELNFCIFIKPQYLHDIN